MKENNVNYDDLKNTYTIAYTTRYPNNVYYEIKAKLNVAATQNMDMHYLALEINEKIHSDSKRKKHE